MVSESNGGAVGPEKARKLLMTTVVSESSLILESEAWMTFASASITVSLQYSHFEPCEFLWYSFTYFCISVKSPVNESSPVTM